MTAAENPRPPHVVLASVQSSRVPRRGVSRSFSKQGHDVFGVQRSASFPGGYHVDETVPEAGEGQHETGDIVQCEGRWRIRIGYCVNAVD